MQRRISLLRRARVSSLIPAVVLGLAGSIAVNAQAARLDAGIADADLDADLDGAVDGAFAGADASGPNDLALMGRQLLDTQDLVKMGGHLLEEPAPAMHHHAAKGTEAGVDPAGASAANSGVPGAGAAGRIANGAPQADGGPSAVLEDGAPAAPTIDAATDVNAGDLVDASVPAVPPLPAVGSTDAPDDGHSAGGPGGRGFGGRGGPKGRDLLAMKGPEDSPLAKMGIPVQAVPAVATVASAGLMAIWPGLSKTLMGLLKGFAASHLKNRAKKSQKVDTGMKTFTLFGISLRPAELGAICVAALVYGLAVCYGFQGLKIKRTFLLQQEALVLAIYYARSVVRFVYERAYKLTTQYRFWVMGGVMCLGSAYLGTTLGTVGYELEASSGPDDAKRIVRMKAVLIVVALAMALCFFAVNLASPAKLLQSGRVMMSGAALAEILPITPMPGKKIYGWNKGAWWALFLVVVPTFYLINFYF